MLQIDTSEDWPMVETELLESTKNLSFTIQKDLEKINKNICSLISELSKAEIDCRRKKKATRKKIFLPLLTASYIMYFLMVP